MGTKKRVKNLKSYFKYNNTKKQRKRQKPNNFERGMYSIMSNDNLIFITEFQIPSTTKFYDAYLPEYNILLEFDGDYYHKDTLMECINKMQIKNFKNDRYKDRLAFKHGYKLVRIKQSANVQSIRTLLHEKEYI